MHVVGCLVSVLRYTDGVDGCQHRVARRLTASVDVAAAGCDCQRTTHVLPTHSLLGHLASCCYGCRAIPVLVVQVTRRCSLNPNAAGLSLLCKRRSGGKRCAGGPQLASHISHSKLRCICAELLGYYITSGPHHHLIMLVPHIPKSHPTLSRW